MFFCCQDVLKNTHKWKQIENYYGNIFSVELDTKCLNKSPGMFLKKNQTKPTNQSNKQKSQPKPNQPNKSLWRLLAAVLLHW